jgi:hypothetical protein
MDGILLLWVVLIPFIVRTDFLMNRSVIVRRDCGGKVNILSVDNIGYYENINFIWREG